MNSRVFRKLYAHHFRMRTVTTTSGTSKPNGTRSQGTDWPTPKQIFTVVAAGFAFYQTPWERELKVTIAVGKILRSFSKTEDTIEQPIERTAELDKLRKRFAVADQRTTIVCGQYQVGKSWLVEEVLHGQRGVLALTVRNRDWEIQLFKSVGLDNLHDFETALVRARFFLGCRPLIVMDVPRNPDTKMSEVSTFCKDLVTDHKLARVVIVASQLSIALGFDAGGAERQANLWIGGLSKTQAVQYISDCRPTLTPAEAQRIVGLVGSTFGKLHSILQKMEGSDMAGPMTCDEALEWHRRKCQASVNRLSSTFVHVRGTQQAVGNIIMEALLKGEHESLNEQLDLLGITNRDAAIVINKQDAHAVSYDTVTDRWHFSSPMHERAARQKKA